MDPIACVESIMTDFADATGLTGTENGLCRYLWTDAFALCNYIALYRQMRAERWRQLAHALVDQVHLILGRHRPDDVRTGWISGLSEDEGRRHPTAGGLRIGKKRNERGSTEPFDQHLEWERDGQYYHYLTKWMHALNRLSRSTGNVDLNRWAVELAKAAHSGFVHVLPNGSKRMYWKMSIDLSYPLVPSMGQHDPLDGWITYNQLEVTAADFSETSPDLGPEIDDMADVCRGKSWATEDPLGIGGLLGDACMLVQLIINKGLADNGLLLELLESSLRGIEAFRGKDPLDLPGEHRLAFRELGLSIGLRAVGKIRELMQANSNKFTGNQRACSHVDRLQHYVPLGETITGFWLEPRNQKSRIWNEHRDINHVMLATSLMPEGYLELQ
jgi:hypothetical protein